MYASKSIRPVRAFDGWGKGKMDNFCVYRVVIQSSDGPESYSREYIGPATSEDDAVEQARTVFKERPGDRILTIEVVDRESWVQDTVLRPTGAPS